MPSCSPDESGHPTTATPPVGPRLLAGLRPLVRERGQVQLGLDPTLSVVLAGAGDTVRDAVEAMAAPVGATVGGCGLDDPGVIDALAVLRAAGLLRDDDAVAGSEHAATALRWRRPWTTGADLPAAREVTAARTRCVIEIRGGRRLAVGIALCLAGAGVGRLHLPDLPRGPVGPADASVMGPGHEHIGRERVATVIARAAAANPGTELLTNAATDPDLVVLAVDSGGDLPVPDPDDTSALMADDVVHLVAAVGGGLGEVGPLVVPGRTACLRCRDEARRDRDPWWPLMAADTRAAWIDPVVADLTVTATAAAAAGAALAWLEHRLGGPAPSVVDAVVGLRAPEHLAVVTPIAAHPRCGCRWPSE